MLTGEDNYRTRGDAVGLDLVGDPELAAERDNASRIAVSYWQARVPEADRDDVSAATLAINGGENGLADRYNRFDAWYAQLTPAFMADLRSEEHTSELQSLMRISQAVFCLKKKK